MTVPDAFDKIANAFHQAHLFYKTLDDAAKATRRRFLARYEPHSNRHFSEARAAREVPPTGLGVKVIVRQSYRQAKCSVVEGQFGRCCIRC
jgi:hypothetical protein